MKLFNIDLHISVIADIKHIFSTFGIEIVNWSLSGHMWVFGQKPDNVVIINQTSWNHLSPELIQKFQERYDEFLSSFDGFICGHPNSFALLYEKYQKPIYVVNTCRYDIPFSFNGNHAMIAELHACFKRLNEKGLLKVVSNNRADRDYFMMGNPGIVPVLIPSLCLYTGMVWNPTKCERKFLMYSDCKSAPQHPLIVKRPSKFEWKDLANYRGIVHIPYEASTMSIFEHISSGIPLFFPTKRFLNELWSSETATFGSNYWRIHAKQSPPSYLSETNLYQYWIDRADYYDIPDYYYFDSFDELLRMLVGFFGDTKYEERKIWLEERKKGVYSEWANLVNPISNL